MMMVMMMEEEEEKKKILWHHTKFVENLTVTKLVNKLPVHKSSSLPNLSPSLANTLQNYPPIYTYIFIKPKFW